jgi:UDP-N-acetylglucosamine 2-epimerase
MRRYRWRTMSVNLGLPRSPLAVCYGTRPQIIKASLLVETLARQWELLTVDTGQHYDAGLSSQFYAQLGVRSPDVTLDVGSSDHAEQTGTILMRAGDVLARRTPWAVVVIGDTNSTLGCALAAAKLRIPVIHVEAGLRAADAMMAEELNRRVVDTISALLCAPSEAAERRLLEEHVGGRVVRTGDIARDVLGRSLGRAPASDLVPDWPLEPAAPFLFATLHRAELVGDPELLGGVVAALGRLDRPVVLAAHPRTRAVLERHRPDGNARGAVHLLPPLGYLETIACIRDAQVVITDSGGVQREAYWLGTPCVTVRGETEWQETVRSGANVLVPPAHAQALLAEVIAERLRRRASGPAWDRDAYGAGGAAVRIRDAIQEWAGSRSP